MPELKKLSEKHKQVMALLAQGVDRVTIAQACDVVPEYVTWLARQPLCQAYLGEMLEHTKVRLEALFERSVDVIADAMSNGSTDERLRAARLQLEATRRVGAHVQVVGTVNHVHSLVGVLSSLPPKGITELPALPLDDPSIIDPDQDLEEIDPDELDPEDIPDIVPEENEDRSKLEHAYHAHAGYADTSNT